MVAYAWATALGEHNGAQLLSKLGLIEQAIDYAIDANDFNHAFQLCNASLREKLPEVHLKYALSLEDKGHFKESEDQFLKAGKPREAIQMYIQQQDWQSAFRIADLFEPSYMTEVQVAQGKALSNKNQLRKAEALFLQAKRPELSIEMYKERNLWEDAVRVAQLHLPSQLSEIQYGMANSVQRFWQNTLA